MERNLPILKWVIVLTIWGFCCWIGIRIAAAHSFYPWECCSAQDCWPMGDGADAREPEPRAGPFGWILADGAVVPYREARLSPDGRFHVCRRGGRADGEVIRPSAKPTCFYAPQPAF